MVENLSGDALLVSLKRIEYENQSLPSLGGIPLLRRIGRGAMGAVYYGVHPRLQNEVAVKVLPAAMAQADPDLSKRLFREAQLAARIRSENLVAVMDVNEENGIFYLIMEYVPGLSAGDYQRRMRESGRPHLAEGEALEICIAATYGLAAAHQAGVIHRDIKPDNIMVPFRRDLPPDEARASLQVHVEASKLADLGLAHLDALDSNLTATCIAMGTPGFLAPEQALDARNARKPADVFSMAATLYSLLAGQAPFTGETPLNIIVAAMQSPHQPVRKLNPKVTERTAALLDKCLEKAPERRVPDGGALLQELIACRREPATRQTTVLNRPPSSASVPVIPAVTPAAPVPSASSSAPTVRQPSPIAQARTQINVPTLISARHAPSVPAQKTEILPAPVFESRASEKTVLKTTILPPPFADAPAVALAAAPADVSVVAAEPATEMAVEEPAALPAQAPAWTEPAEPEFQDEAEPAPASAPVPARHRQPPVPPAGPERLQQVVRMILDRGRSELPAVQRFVGEVSTALMSEKTSGAKLTQLILKDASLTQSLLKTVNSLYYNPARPIETISHAVLVLGVNTIAQLATCLTFLDQFKGREDLDDLRNAILRIMMSGKFACELCVHDPHTELETAFIAGMMHNLGELLVAFHLSDEYGMIKEQLAHHSRAWASHKVLGATFHEIGREVAVQWNLAPKISDAMSEFDHEQRPARNNRAQRLHALVSCAGELSETVGLTTPEDRAQHVHEVMLRFESFLPLSEKQRDSLKAFSETSLTESACVLHVAGVRAQRKRLVGEDRPPSSVKLAGMTLHENAKALQQSLEKVSQSLLREFNLPELLALAVKGLFDGLKPEHAVLLLTTPSRDELRARIGHGPHIEELLKSFQVRLDGSGGSVAAVIAENREWVVSDVQKAEGLPPKVKTLIGAGRFAMVPIKPLENAIGGLYVQRRQGDQAPVEFDLTQMRLFRDKIATAMRKANAT